MYPFILHWIFLLLLLLLIYLYLNRCFVFFFDPFSPYDSFIVWASDGVLVFFCLCFKFAWNEGHKKNAMILILVIALARETNRFSKNCNKIQFPFMKCAQKFFFPYECMHWHCNRRRRRRCRHRLSALSTFKYQFKCLNCWNGKGSQVGVLVNLWAAKCMYGVVVCL